MDNGLLSILSVRIFVLQSISKTCLVQICLGILTKQPNLTIKEATGACVFAPD